MIHMLLFLFAYLPHLPFSCDSFLSHFFLVKKSLPFLPYISYSIVYCMYSFISYKVIFIFEMIYYFIGNFFLSSVTSCLNFYNSDLWFSFPFFHNFIIYFSIFISTSLPLLAHFEIPVAFLT